MATGTKVRAIVEFDEIGESCWCGSLEIVGEYTLGEPGWWDDNHYRMRAPSPGSWDWDISNIKIKAGFDAAGEFLNLTPRRVEVATQQVADHFCDDDEWATEKLNDAMSAC